MSPTQAQALAAALEVAVMAAYPKCKPGRAGLWDYTLTIFHEAAHALMAYQYGVVISNVRLTPWVGGGSIDTRDIDYRLSAHQRSLIDAKIAMAGFCADRIFRHLPGYEPESANPDAYVALATLERGDIAGTNVLSIYLQLCGDQISGIPNSQRALMCEAYRKMLDRTTACDIKPIRTWAEAVAEREQLCKETSQWVIDHLSDLIFLVADFAKRRRKGNQGKGMDVRPAFKALARVHAGLP